MVTDVPMQQGPAAATHAAVRAYLSKADPDELWTAIRTVSTGQRHVRRRRLCAPSSLTSRGERRLCRPRHASRPLRYTRRDRRCDGLSQFQPRISDFRGGYQRRRLPSQVVGRVSGSPILRHACPLSTRWILVNLSHKTSVYKTPRGRLKTLVKG